MKGNENRAAIHSPQLFFFGQRHGGAEQGDKDDEIFYHVVAERALKLRDDERPEAASVLARLRRDKL